MINKHIFTLVRTSDDECGRAWRLMGWIRWRCRRAGCSAVARFVPRMADDRVALALSKVRLCRECACDYAEYAHKRGYSCVVDDLFSGDTFVLAAVHREAN